MLKLLVSLVGLLLRSHTEIVTDNLALGHQLIVLQRSVKRHRQTLLEKCLALRLSIYTLRPLALSSAWICAKPPGGLEPPT